MTRSALPALALCLVLQVQPPAPPGKFDDDLAFLKQHTSVIVLTGGSGARVVVAPEYQGRVTREVEIGFVSELCHIPPETLGKHRDLWGHADTHRCSVKSLIGTALVGIGVRQHARAGSISKRAPSSASARA